MTEVLPGTDQRKPKKLSSKGDSSFSLRDSPSLTKSRSKKWIDKCPADNCTPGQSSSYAESLSIANSRSHSTRKLSAVDVEMGIKHVEVIDKYNSIHTVEVLKRPGQTLGFYIREGDGVSRKRGVFISRIAEGSIVQRNGLLNVGDEIMEINGVNVTKTNLDDVVVLMSIPRKLILTTRVRVKERRRGKSLDVQRLTRVPENHADSPQISMFSSAEYPKKYGYLVDLNPEDSNDSGLSSEQSVKDDRAGDSELDELYESSTLPRAKPKTQTWSSSPSSTLQRKKSELYTSDGEHEYIPGTGTLKQNRSHLPKHLASGRRENNSDSETVSNYASLRKHTNLSRFSSMRSQEDHVPSTPKLKGPGHLWSSSLGRSLSRKKSGVGHQPHTEESGTEPDNILPHQSSVPYYNSAHQENGSIPSPYGTPTKQRFGVKTPSHQVSVSQERKLSSQSDSMNSPSNSTHAQSSGILMSLPDMGTMSTSYLKSLPQFIKTPLNVNVEEFVLYRPEMVKERCDSSIGPGNMQCHVLCGHGLKSSRMELKDLYCVFEIDSTRVAKSMVRTGAINYDWDETFNIPVPPNSKVMACLVYHWFSNSRHRLCFSGIIHLKNFFKESVDKKIAVKMEPKGILYLNISFKATDSGNSPNCQSSQSTALVKSSFCIMKRLVKEINKRGLQSVGLYRISSSIRKKGELKNQLKVDPNMDLSEESFPDIHLLSSVLKDTLRELPQPLLPESAYRAVEQYKKRESAGDCLTQTSDVINKLQELMDPISKEILFLILNHLKLVTHFAEENKMSSHNLAVCLSPIFTGERGDNSTEPSTSVQDGTSVVRFLIDIWPDSQGIVGEE